MSDEGDAEVSIALRLYDDVRCRSGASGVPNVSDSDARVPGSHDPDSRDSDSGDSDCRDSDSGDAAGVLKAVRLVNCDSCYSGNCSMTCVIVEYGGA